MADEPFRHAGRTFRGMTQGDNRLAISNAIVGLYREHYGKGPTKSKTYLQDDIVLTVLWGGIVQIEKTLSADGKEDIVHEMRRAFQHVKRDEFVSTVEELTGRKVAVFMSQFDPESDISIEFFQLA
jgi:uncharacterized protein YbcI